MLLLLLLFCEDDSAEASGGDEVDRDIAVDVDIEEVCRSAVDDPCLGGAEKEFKENGAREVPFVQLSSVKVSADRSTLLLLGDE